jgi:hypothetical protein
MIEYVLKGSAKGLLGLDVKFGYEKTEYFLYEEILVLVLFFGELVAESFD